MRAYGSDLRDLLTTTGEVEHDDLEGAAALWLTKGRVRWAPKTTCRRYASVRSYARHHGRRDFLVDYRLPDPGKATPHPLPEGMAGIERLLVACGRNMQHRALVTLCGKTALRVGEALTVSPSSFDLEQRTLRVLGKGDKIRHVPVPTTAWPDLTPAIAGAGYLGPSAPLVPLKDRRARQVITDLGVRAGLSRPIASHDLRATAATHLYEVTKDPRVVQEILGHADLSTTEVYTEISMNTMRDAMEKANS